MDAPDRELIAELAREVVTTKAPEELPLFRATSEAYFRTPQSVVPRVGARDDTLGFGADAFVSLTPFALAVASSVVAFLAQQTAAVAGEAVRDVLRRWLDRLRSEGQSEDEAPRLTADQLAQVRDVAYQKARALELSDAQAGLLADSMAGSLASPA